MNWYDLFGNDTNKEVTPGSVLPTQPTPVPYNNSADKYSALINHYNELAKAQPQQDTGVDWGKIIAQAAAGYGNAIALGAGAQAPNNVQAIGDSFDKIRQQRYQNALDAWKTQLGVAQNEAGLYKDQAAIDAAKLKAEREQKTAEAQAKMYGAEGDLATARAKQVGQLTPYQKQQLALQQDRLNEDNRHNTTMEGIGRDKVTNANGGTVSPEPGQNTNPAYVKTSQQEAAKQDVKLLADEPNIVKRQQMIDEVLGTKDKAGLLNTMIKNDEIGTKWQTAGKLVENLPGVAGKMATTVRESSLSANQQRYKAIMESMAQDIINDAKGVATDSDREAARKIMSGTLEMDPEAAKTALLQVQDYNNRVAQRIHEAKTRMGRQEIPLTAPKATSANLDKYGF